MTIFICEDTPDGIFTGVYEAWASKVGHSNVKLQVGENQNYELFCDYKMVEPDGEKARKVARTIYQRLGLEVYKNILHALYSVDERKADVVYQTIVIGFSMRDGRKVLQHLGNESVRVVNELYIKVWHEAHRYLGFVRFKELKSGILLSKISPLADVLPLIGEHFADRYPMERFAIYDEKRKKFLVHDKEKAWGIVEGASLNEKVFGNLSEKEEEFQRLWEGFCKSISIEERESRKRQQRMLPKMYRENMVEFKEKRV